MSRDITLALAHQRAGRLAEAGQCCRAVLDRQPSHPDALHLLGLLAHQVGDHSGAATLLRHAIAGAPRSARFHANLGVVLLRQRRAADAVAALRTATRLDQRDFDAHANLGVALFASGDHAGAARAAGAALRLRPGDVPTLCNRALALQAAGQLGPALASTEAALAANPASHAAHLARGGLLLSLGRTADALAAFEAAVALQPDDLPARQARIAAASYLPGVTTQAIGRTARRWAPAPIAASAPFPGLDRSPDRPLRIGYVSADFRDHPVGYFLEGALAPRDRASAVVFCYDNAAEGDAVTARLKALVECWRPIAALDARSAADLVRSDRIDILVDLAGHTKGNRLDLFAQRAAPVQAAWLGYFGTTGGAAVDVIIADGVVLPPAEERFFTERVVRLPDSYLCVTPPAEAGPVVPPPGLDRPVTFGCFNNRAKLNPAVLALWARLLARVPGSRLLLKSHQFADKEQRREIARAFAGHAIAAERLAFEPASPLRAMFDAYNRVDIALDPFPFTGGATTAQALWMGVPVVTLRGQTWAGRQGASLLAAAGLTEWVAEDEDGYVAIAERLATDRPGLRALRASQRDRLAASPLGRADRFAGHLEGAYRAMWQHWLREGSPA